MNSWCFQPVDEKKAGLGIFSIAERVCVPAFGPQTRSLRDPSSFGMAQVERDEAGFPIFSSLAQERDLWLETKISPEGRIFARIYGVTPEFPVFFVFYLKADSAVVENVSYLPRSLQRYQGDVKQVAFFVGEELFSIHSEGTAKMELIPLAGGGCFWDSDFLLAFEAPSGSDKLNFALSPLEKIDLSRYQSCAHSR